MILKFADKKQKEKETEKESWNNREDKGGSWDEDPMGGASLFVRLGNVRGCEAWCTAMRLRYHTIRPVF